MKSRGRKVFNVVNDAGGLTWFIGCGITCANSKRTSIMQPPIAPENNTPHVSRRQFISTGALATGGILLAGVSCSTTDHAQPAPVAGVGTPTPFVTPPLPYDYKALEPYIDAQTMQIHHDRHHEGYTRNLNAALDQEPQLKGRTIEQLMAGTAALPASARMSIRNHGGGYYNHNLFWEIMAPAAGSMPGEPLASALTKAYGGLDKFKAQFTDAGMKRFGSGWAWLIVKADRSLAITSTPNQDNPLMNGIADATGTPILGLDVWEHAYYLKYQNRRAEYIAAWWQVVNWANVSARYAAAIR